MSRAIRNLDLTGIATLLDWAAAEGWNPGLNDALAFQAADPNGFFGAFIDDQMVAGISAVAYDSHYGFIGLYICHPDWRGQGHGKAVWDTAMTYLGSRTIGLDGVPEQQANYAAMGFVAAHETIRMSGTLAARTAPAMPPAEPALVAALDAQCFPTPRNAFVQHWLASPNSSAVLSENGQPIAYAVRRNCREGTKLGPLFAQDLQAATSILDALTGPIQIDVPAYQVDWLKVLEERDLTPGFRTARMYREAPPQILREKVFGISTLELG